MLANSERFRLLGTYATPAFQYGDIVEDERRGEVEIVALTDAPIPWPTGRPTKKGHRRQRAIVLFDCLAEAVRSEATQAVAHWWGVTSQTVTVWRNALGCDRIAPGTRRLHQLNFAAGVGEAMAAKRPESLQRPERGRKISLAKQGKPRPDVAKRNLKRRGSKLSAETRQKMSEAHRRRGPVAREGYRPWTATEDELVRTLPASEVAQQTGRTLSAVNQRRMMLGVRRRPLQTAFNDEITARVATILV